MSKDQNQFPFERDLESWICDNINQVVHHDEAVLVGRQIWTPHGGRLDVLAAVPNSESDLWEWVVVEVKRREADLAALNQLMRYMGSVTYAGTFTRWSPWVDWKRYATGDAHPKVRGILAAPTFSDEVGQAIHAFGRRLTTFHLDLSKPSFDPFPIPELPDTAPESALESWQKSVRGAVTRLMVRREHA